MRRRVDPPLALYYIVKVYFEGQSTFSVISRMSTRFWFRPTEGDTDALVTRLSKAGHTDVVARDGLVGFVPFETPPSQDFSWVERVESHFRCKIEAVS